MSEEHIGRRRVLGLGAAGALGLWTGPALTAAAPSQQEAGTPVQFTVDIPGLPAASKNIREISIDELNVNGRLLGRENEFWSVSPRDVAFGSARIVSAAGPGSTKELQLWFQEAAKGKNIRKNITVTLFKSDKSPGRSYSLFDCFPAQWSCVNFDTSSTVQTETLTVNIGRIEFKT